MEPVTKENRNFIAIPDLRVYLPPADSQTIGINARFQDIIILYCGQRECILNWKGSDDGGSIPKNPGMRDFVDQVREKLETYSPETVKDIIIRWAISTPPGKRIEFLDRLTHLSPKENTHIGGPELIDEINGLAKRVENGNYGEYRGEDDYPYGEDFSDESWADEIDTFMEDARSNMKSGSYALARDAYSMLFRILESGEESGHLPGNYDPASMLSTDLNEARSCYLLSVYFTSPPEMRPVNLYEGMQRFATLVGDDLNLRSMKSAGLEILPDFDEFLEAWIELLRGKNSTFTRYLLREAVILSGGINAIAELAQKTGSEHPSAYIAWIEMLEKEGNFVDMARAAEKGLASVPGDYVRRAEIGECLVRAGEHLGNIDLQISGSHEAFYSFPSLKNLLSLLLIAEKQNGYYGEIEAAISRIDSLIRDKRKNNVPVSMEDEESSKSFAGDSLLVQTFLLGGRYEDAFNSIISKPSLGWSYGDNQKGLVLAFFLKLLAGEKDAHSASNIERLWEDSTGHTGFLFMDQEGIAKRFGTAMDKIFRSAKLSDDEKVKYTKWCVEETGKRTDAIVGGKHRNSYNKAAVVLVACAEMLSKHGERSAGKELVEGYRSKYNRHSAFQGELRNALRIASL